MDIEKELVVFISNKNSTCDECKEVLGKGAWITLERDKGALCLSCSDLAHLVFLPSGDAALTRRSKKYSTLFAKILKWSKSRKRYERQGLLVEQKALAQAEKECLDDEDIRARKRERAAEKRVFQDKVYIQSFAQRIQVLYPSCPATRAKKIAEHACQKYSGRVGRSAAAKNLDDNTIRLALIAHIRHKETNYDTLLAMGCDRQEARIQVMEMISKILKKWET